MPGPSLELAVSEPGQYKIAAYSRRGKHRFSCSIVETEVQGPLAVDLESGIGDHELFLDFEPSQVVHEWMLWCEPAGGRTSLAVGSLVPLSGTCEFTGLPAPRGWFSGEVQGASGKKLDFDLSRQQRYTF